MVQSRHFNTAQAIVYVPDTQVEGLGQGVEEKRQWNLVCGQTSLVPGNRANRYRQKLY